MIQEYKNQIRYWVAVTFGDLETAHQQDVCELICPDCEMKTSINVSQSGTQSCYFCDGNLINEDTIEIKNEFTATTEQEFSQESSATRTKAQTQENTEQMATAR